MVNLKKLNLSFNKLESFPSLFSEEASSHIEYLDLSYNNIEEIEIKSMFFDIIFLKKI